MATAGLFAKSEHEELNRITSKSILEKLMNIRQKINVGFTSRRLVWELIQNAKDNVNLCNETEETVDINISLSDNEFVFSHNKGFFTSAHTRGLVRKYSSGDKERNTEQLGLAYKTTGRFGTGFMNTHILSENVQVNSMFKHDDTGLFHTVRFWLDRTGKTEAKIVEGMNKAFGQTEDSISASEGLEFSEAELNTSFTYPLLEQTWKYAKFAIDEVKNGIGYTLLNVPSINSITIVEDIFDETSYKLKSFDTFFLSGASCDVFNLLINDQISNEYFVTLSKNNVQIIIPVGYENEIYYIKELDNSIPRIHLDFPMIGTEDLNLPFVINSTLFEPTEPRDGISLIDDEDNEFAQLNCSLIDQAVDLYKLFIAYVENDTEWNDLFNLARIKSPAGHSWIDQQWFKLNVINSIRSTILHSSIVIVDDSSRKSIRGELDEHQVYFPYANKQNIRKSIWSLSTQLYPGSLPAGEHIDFWNEIIWDNCYRMSIAVLSQVIKDAGSINGLADLLNSDEITALKFLNNYYILLNEEGTHIDEVLKGTFEVIPNQLGEFKSKTDLFVDKGIDEEIKNALALVIDDPRSYLVHKKANTSNGIKYGVKTQDQLITELNSIIKDDKNQNNIPALCDYLASLFQKKITLNAGN